MAFGVGCVALTVLVGCGTTQERAGIERSGTNAAPTPSWNKFFVAGSRIARDVDASGNPLTGLHVITITDEQLRNSAGVHLGDKLSGGYPR